MVDVVLDRYFGVSAVLRRNFRAISVGHLASMESGWFYNRQILILPIAARGPISSGASEVAGSLKSSVPMRVSNLSGVTSQGGIPAVSWAYAGRVALPAKMVTAMAPVTAALMNFGFVVLIVHLIVACRPNESL